MATRPHLSLRPGILIAGAALLGLCLSACQSDNTGPEAPAPGHGEAHLSQLLHNPKWYRTLDSTNILDPAEGSLIFSWVYADAARHPDSFFLGVDTLWSLPQDVKGDTASDWDLGICPAGFCIGGIKSGLFGVNVATPFADPGSGLDIDTFVTEHHFQFTPALAAGGARPLAPDSSILGALMFVRSRSGSSRTDTVFGFAAWRLEWDSAYLPPVRPVNGYLPKRSDFSIVNARVRYQPHP
jgi:hypothetical protein